jgi:hypothetical protein
MVDVLDDAQLLEEVEALVRGALRGPQALGRGVEVERRDAERGLDAASHVPGQQLAAARDDPRRDAQPAR